MPSSLARTFALGASAFVFTTGAASAATTVAAVPRAAFSDLGRAPAGVRLELALTLAYRNVALLHQLERLQRDPASPAYARWLSNAEFADAFAPTPAQYARVAATLRGAGFTVTQTFANRTVIDASGTVGAAEKLFATEIHRVLQPGRGERYVNIRPAPAPPALEGLITSVDGLHDLSVVRSAIARVRPRAGAQFEDDLEPDAAGQPLKGPVSGETHQSGFGPLAFSAGYDLPQQHEIEPRRYYDGSGRASGVVIDADFLDSDLAAFLRYFKVTRDGPATTRVAIDGGPPGGDGSPDSLETTLDVETIVSNAPGTALYVYEFPSFDNTAYITDAYNRVVSDNIVDTANSSFGGCETSIGASTDRAWDQIAEQGAVKGITFHASSGDGGSDGGCVSAPASGPHFVAVGGTSLSVTAKGKYVSESAWSGSGGGVSTVFSLPSFQAGVPNTIASGRNVPDVAFDANPSTGAAFYYGGSWDTAYDPLGGTSLSSPIFGAALTEIDQLLGTRSGYFNPALYAFFAKNGYGSKKSPYFHDVTSGGNGEYKALTGYDQVTGIGSLDVFNTGEAL